MIGALQFVCWFVVVVVFFSAILQGSWASVRVLLRYENNALCKPHKVSILASPDVI